MGNADSGKSMVGIALRVNNRSAAIVMMTKHTNPTVLAILAGELPVTSRLNGNGACHGLERSQTISSSSN